ncbi:MAG TPA: 4-(cytidine 5'-diphospho)-2-C-methyl-D-erythritol kinase [Aliidongia sp.]|nr:4-(cytidine 5'-diphospho)-2-C-methyl-D-erythritol kinase [Aliidongia sp.]
MTIVSRPAPAKLNLTLEVVGKRADGYHLLDSLVAFTAYGDTVEARPGSGLSLAMDGPFGTRLAGDTAENLVLRAARTLAEAAGVKADAALHLTKRLPIASGIGGGSSDAAAALLALAALWRIDPAPEDLARLALTLGADVPVCLKHRPARLQGIGDRVDPAPILPAAPILLVNPGIGLPTPSVFKARQGAFSAGAGAHGVLTEPPADVEALALALRRHGNDLTQAAIGLLPAIAEILAALEALPGCLLARMSGSGATCFALFRDAASAQAAEASLSTRHPGWWAVATRLQSDG